ncbi:ankyrin repeat domain-containing protein [Paracidovorax citrulli]
MLVHPAGSPSMQTAPNGGDPGPQLIAAVREDRRQVIELLLHRCPESVHYQDERLNTALHYAIERGSSYPIVRMLLGCGANPGARNARGDTCMHLAFARRPVSGQLPIILLGGTWNDQGLGLGAIELQNRDGKTALDLARDRRGHVFPGLMEAVMQTEARLHDRRLALVRQLREAIAIDSLEPAEAALVQLQWPFDMRLSENGDRLLMAALRAGARRIADRLMSAAEETGMAKAVLNCKDGTGESTPLAWAVRAHNPRMVEVMLKYGADPNLVVADGYTALHIAVQEDLPNMVRLLLDYGASPDVHASLERTTPLMLAAKAGLSDIALELLDRGANVKAKDIYGCDAAHHAKAGRHMRLASRLSRPQQMSVESPAAAAQDERKGRPRKNLRFPPRQIACLACCAIV